MHGCTAITNKSRLCRVDFNVWVILLVPFLTLLVGYILAPTLTVSWQGIAEGALLGGGGGGWFWGLARGRLAVGCCVGGVLLGVGFRACGGGGSCSLWRRILG